MRSLAKHLTSRGHDVVVPRLPRFGTHELAREDAVVAEAVEAMGDGVIVVGHSAGGLLALRAAQNAEVGPHIRAVVGLGAAFLGAPGPRFLRRLAYRLAPATRGYSATRPWPVADVPETVTVVSVVSDADSVVPPEFSQVGEVVEVSGVPHGRLPAQHELIADLIARLER